MDKPFFNFSVMQKTLFCRKNETIRYHTVNCENFCMPSCTYYPAVTQTPVVLFLLYL